MITGKTRTTIPKQRKRAAQRAAALMRAVQNALPNVQTGKIHDIKTCRRSTIGGLTIYENGRIDGLRTCKSGWACLHCTPKYLLDRAGELDELLGWAYRHGYTVAMMTATHRHTKSQRLDNLAARHIAALRDLHKTRAWRQIKPIGIVSGRDCKFGANGWHFHSHDLLILDKSGEQRLKASEKEVKKAWAKCCKKNNLTSSKVNGLNFVYDVHSPEYISKFDYKPKEPPTIDKEHENSFSPFELIEQSTMNKFLEFLCATIGIQRISWSKNLRKLTGIERAEKQRAKANKARKKQAKAITLPPQLVSNIYDNIDEIRAFIKQNGLDVFMKTLNEFLTNSNEKEKFSLIVHKDENSNKDWRSVWNEL